MQFNWLDYTFLGLIACSTLLSLTRGLVRELCSLLNWMTAIWLGFCWAQPAAAKLPEGIHSPSFRLLLGFTVIFMLILLSGAMLGWLFSQLVARTGMGGTDRLLGLVFGALRGILIVTLVLLLAELTPLPDESWWHASVLIPFFQPLEQWLTDILPTTISQHLQPTLYDSLP